jgi:hypothetical protein
MKLPTIEEQVCSFEQAVKLFMLIGNNESTFYWYEDQTLIYSDDLYSSSMMFYPAYTLSEIFKIIPWEIKYDTGSIISVHVHRLTIEFDDESKKYSLIYSGLFMESNTNLIIAACNILIRLIDEKYLKAEDLNG